MTVLDERPVRSEPFAGVDDEPVVALNAGLAGQLPDAFAAEVIRDAYGEFVRPVHGEQVPVDCVLPGDYVYDEGGLWMRVDDRRPDPQDPERTLLRLRGRLGLVFTMRVPVDRQVFAWGPVDVAVYALLAEGAGSGGWGA